jgi:uncharacterized protein with HEPN domain
VTRSARFWLEDIIEAAELLQQYVAGIDYNEFIADVEKQDAVARRLEIIGQAVKELPEDLRGDYPSVAWRDIAGARDIVAHEYFRVDLALVWGMVTKDVPQLAKQVRVILRESPSD